MVPESATAVVSGQLPDFAGLLDAFAKEHQLKYEISTVDEETYTVTIVGNLLMDQLLKMGSMVRPTWLSC